MRTQTLILRQSPPECYPDRGPNRLEVYTFCDGETHRFMEIRRGHCEPDPTPLGRTYFYPDVCPCDKECVSWREVPITILPVHVRVGLKYGFVVPAGKHFVHQRRFRTGNCNFRIDGPGSYVPAEIWAQGFLLEPGQQVEVYRTFYFDDGGTNVVTLTNNDGKIEIDDPSRATRVAYALERLEEVRLLGFRSSRALHIVRSAGPRFCLEAVEWAESAYNEILHKHDTNTDRLSQLRDLIRVLNQVRNSFDLGRDWVEKHLGDIGVTPPDTRSNAIYFKILSGAFYALEWWRNQTVREMSQAETWAFPEAGETDVSSDRYPDGHRSLEKVQETRV